MAEVDGREEKMVVFVCENTPEGIFTGVYDAWSSRLGHANVRLEVQGEYNYSLFSEYREVKTDRIKAQKVVRSVRRSLSELAYSWIYRTTLSEREDRADAIYRFLVCGFSAGAAGRQITENLQIPAVQAVFQINRAVANEAHLQTEFLRFAEYSDRVLFSEIGPKNRVTALLMPYFADRLLSEPFIIYDKNHQEAGVWTGKGKWYMMRGNEAKPLQFLSGKTDQSKYAALWSAFFDQIGIKERENPICQRTHLPFRYRKYMTEFQADSNRSNLTER